MIGLKFSRRPGVRTATVYVLVVQRMLRGLLVLMAASSVGFGSSASVPVFRGGRVLLPVVIAVDASPEERTAADDLARVLGLMSGLKWPVLTEVPLGMVGFHVGRSHSARQSFELKVATDLLASAKTEVGPDTFRLRSEHGSVFIEGATPEATGFAVTWLLQHYGGVRWYAPGAIGEVIPRCTEWSLPELDEVHQPGYLSREIWGLIGPEGKDWARRNGLCGHLEFSHALSDVFSRETMASNPNWGPLLKGQRYEPGSADDDHWQPNLALPEVAEHAARAAAASFAHHPFQVSYSLGINDTVRFDQSEATRKLVEPLRYFRGMPDYSTLVFTFMNRAAEVLAKTYPNRYLGCLAYFWCEDPPPFQVSPRVMPYVTTDRSQYYDEGYRAADLSLMTRWGASGVKAFGLWEYADGQGFLVPRVPCHALAEAVREGWRRGARGYVAEAGPRQGIDEFKLWLLAQLMWAPERSLQELTDDFYRGYFGSAEKPMRQFFEACEARWSGQSGPPYWLKYYQQEDQALLFPPGTCRKLRKMLNAAKKMAKDDDAVTQRVDQTSRAFAITEAYVAFDAARRDLAAVAEEEATSKRPDESSLAAAIRTLIERRSHLEKVYRDAENSETAARKELACFVRNDPVPRLLWLAGQRDLGAPQRILELSGADVVASAEWWHLANSFRAPDLLQWPELAVNGTFVRSMGNIQEPRFLYPHSGLLPEGWVVQSMPTEKGKVSLVESPLTAGPRVLRIEGAWDTQVYQWLPAKPGFVYVARAQLRGYSSPGNDSALFLTFLSAAGKVVGVYRMQSLPKDETVKWRTATLVDAVPEGAAWVGIGVGSSRQGQGDWLEVSSVSLIGGKCAP